MRVATIRGAAYIYNGAESKNHHYNVFTNVDTETVINDLIDKVVLTLLL